LELCHLFNLSHGVCFDQKWSQTHQWWLLCRTHDTSPITGEVLPPLPGVSGTVVDKTLRPNHILRGQIIEYRKNLACFALG
jgi:hypothetical protein